MALKTLTLWAALCCGLGWVGGAARGTEAAWCAGPLPALFPDRPAWLGALPPTSAGKSVPLRVTVSGGEPEDGVGLLDQFPNGADRPSEGLMSGQSRTFLLSSKGRTVLFATAGWKYRAFRWLPGRTPSRVTVTLSPGGVRLSVPASPLPCRAAGP